MSQNIQPPALPNTASTSDSERTHRNKKKKHLYAVGSSYVGKCDEMKEHVYDVGPTKSLDLFAKAT
jgi:hypothetical protein